MRLSLAAFICAFMTTYCAAARAQNAPVPHAATPSDTQSSEVDFVKWAKHALAPLSTVGPGAPWADLRALGKMVGSATVVALSEAPHMAAEPLEFRNRVLQYLVEQKGFTAIAIESGIVEGRTVHDYVRGGPGDLAAVVAQGIGWNWDQLPQNHALVRWIRDYNADPRHTAKVNFYGFDVPGSPGDPKANRGMNTALAEALKYLATVDSTSAALFHARVDSFLTNIRFDPGRAADSPGYERLSQAERDTLTAAIADLVSLLEHKEAQYTAASSASDYQWAYRAAIGARQADLWLRQTPVGWHPSNEPNSSAEQARFESAAADVKDRAMADNLDWIFTQEGPRGKILVFAARYHLSSAPLKTALPVALGTGQPPQEVAGTYLRRRLGERLLTIGNLIGKGSVGCAGATHTLKPTPPASIAGLAGQLGAPLYLLDLRSAPAPVANWLNQEHPLGQEGIVSNLAVGRSFDVLFYLNAVTPACGT
jgi:erythromycin esterase